jgi:hypothetical protein
MYNLGKFFGSLVNLALYAGIIYDGVSNFRNEKSFVLNIIAFILLVSIKEIVRALFISASATEFIAFHLLEQSQKSTNKKDAINNIFNNITKDL